MTIDNNKNLKITRFMNLKGEEEVEAITIPTLIDKSQEKKSNIECFRCHIYGLYQSECQTNLDKEHGEKSNFVEKQEGISLLMACYAKEETHQNMWYLDTSYNNHMCGDKNLFSKLDESF